MVETATKEYLWVEYIQKIKLIHKNGIAGAQKENQQLATAKLFLALQTFVWFSTLQIAPYKFIVILRNLRPPILLLWKQLQEQTTPIALYMQT